MGALLHKKDSFNFRRAETVEHPGWNYFDDLPVTVVVRNNLIVGFRADYFLRDRVRYAADGFRRQRLTVPLVKGQPVEVETALVVWWDLVYQQEINLMYGPVQPYWFWTYFLLRRISFLSASGRTYSIELNRWCSVYQGSHGLRCCRSARVTIPVRSPYEEDLNLPGPGYSPRHFAWVWLQVLHPGRVYSGHRFNPRWYSEYKPKYRVSVAVFQVSPYQQLLED